MKPIFKIILVLLGLLAFGSEFFLLAGESHGHWWNHIPGFYAWWGFLGCAVIILVSKWLGKLFIQKREDFYDAH
jgi:membrane protein implicated in regulation of membrane protease activity